MHAWQRFASPVVVLSKKEERIGAPQKVIRKKGKAVSRPHPHLHSHLCPCLMHHLDFTHAEKEKRNHLLILGEGGSEP